MARSDSFAKHMDTLRLTGKIDLDGEPAEELWRLDEDETDMVTGAQVAAVFGPNLIHYTLATHLPSIRREGQVGLEGRGLWLTPSPYAGCQAPYNLGLRSGINVCLTINIESVDALWGPGTAGQGAAPWPGGGIEFYCPHPLPTHLVTSYRLLESCGDL